MMTFARSVAKKVLPGSVVDWLRGPRPADIAWVPGPLTYNQDGLATRHNCDFMHEPRFAEAYRLGKSTGSWGDSEIHWRAYVVHDRLFF